MADRIDADAGLCGDLADLQNCIHPRMISPDSGCRWHSCRSPRCHLPPTRRLSTGRTDFFKHARRRRHVTEHRQASTDGELPQGTCVGTRGVSAELSGLARVAVMQPADFRCRG